MSNNELLSQMQEATQAARGQGKSGGIGAVTMSENNTIKEYQLRYFEDSAEMAAFFDIHHATFSLVFATTIAAAQQMADNYRPSAMRISL